MSKRKMEFYTWSLESMSKRTKENNIFNDEFLKCYCVPFNGDVDLAYYLAEKYSDKIYEFYGNDGYFASGRRVPFKTTHDIGPLVKALRSRGIHFNYTLNAASIETYINNETLLLDHLEYLHKCGVEWITLTHPIFLKQLKSMGFSVANSAVQVIRCLPDLHWLEQLGYDRIILAEDLNRNIRKMRELITHINTPVEIIMNNACMKNCPMRFTHYSLDSLFKTNIPDEAWKRFYKAVLQCKRTWSENPSFFLKSTWFRPEEKTRLLEIGVSLFKIAGRDFSSEKMKRVVEIYLCEEYNGFVFDYLKPLDSPEDKYGIKNINNKDLDSYFNDVFDVELGCKGDCLNCNICNSYSKLLFG